MMNGTLYLVPTPIDDDGELVAESVARLQRGVRAGAVFAIEDLKPGRRRWLRWKLPREVVDQFVLYNEHSREQQLEHLIATLRVGKDVYLMSDGGMPAFCDPGQQLVDRCHELGIRVDAFDFYNSVVLAVALSGFDHRSFIFEGFLPRDRQERDRFLDQLYQQPRSIVLMDTPYRLIRLLNDLAHLEHKYLPRRIFIGFDLTTPQQELVRGTATNLLKKLPERLKREFVIVIESLENI